MSKYDLRERVRTFVGDTENPLLKIVAPVSALTALLFILSGFPDDVEHVILLFGGASGVVATSYFLVALRAAFDAPIAPPRRARNEDESIQSINYDSRR